MRRAFVLQKMTALRTAVFRLFVKTGGVAMTPSRSWVRFSFFIRFNSVSESFDSDSTRDSQWLLRIDSNQLMTRNGFLEFESNQVMTQMAFQNFDSNRLTTQKAFQSFDSNQLATEKAFQNFDSHSLTTQKKLSGILI